MESALSSHHGFGGRSGVEEQKERRENRQMVLTRDQRENDGEDANSSPIAQLRSKSNKASNLRRCLLDIVDSTGP